MQRSTQSAIRRMCSLLCRYFSSNYYKVQSTYSILVYSHLHLYTTMYLQASCCFILDGSQTQAYRQPISKIHRVHTTIPSCNLGIYIYSWLIVIKCTATKWECLQITIGYTISIALLSYQHAIIINIGLTLDMDCDPATELYSDGFSPTINATCSLFGDADFSWSLFKTCLTAGCLQIIIGYTIHIVLLLQYHPCNIIRYSRIAISVSIAEITLPPLQLSQ